MALYAFEAKSAECFTGMVLALVATQFSCAPELTGVVYAARPKGNVASLSAAAKPREICPEHSSCAFWRKCGGVIRLAHSFSSCITCLDAYATSCCEKKDKIEGISEDRNRTCETRPWPEVE